MWIRKWRFKIDKLGASATLLEELASEHTLSYINSKLQLASCSKKKKNVNFTSELTC